MKKSGRDNCCAICGFPISAATIHDFYMESRKPIDWPICANHLVLWATRRLSPQDVKKLREIAKEETFATHGDFYDAEGNSVQPI